MLRLLFSFILVFSLPLSASVDKPSVDCETLFQSAFEPRTRSKHRTRILDTTHIKTVDEALIAIDQSMRNIIQTGDKDHVKLYEEMEELQKRYPSEGEVSAEYWRTTLKRLDDGIQLVKRLLELEIPRLTQHTLYLDDTILPPEYVESHLNKRYKPMFDVIEDAIALAKSDLNQRTLVRVFFYYYFLLEEAIPKGYIEGTTRSSDFNNIQRAITEGLGPEDAPVYILLNREFTIEEYLAALEQPRMEYLLIPLYGLDLENRKIIRKEVDTVVFTYMRNDTTHDLNHVIVRSRNDYSLLPSGLRDPRARIGIPQRERARYFPRWMRELNRARLNIESPALREQVAWTMFILYHESSFASRDPVFTLAFLDKKITEEMLSGGSALTFDQTAAEQRDKLPHHRLYKESPHPELTEQSIQWVTDFLRNKIVNNRLYDHIDFSLTADE